MQYRKTLFGACLLALIVVPILVYAASSGYRYYRMVSAEVVTQPVTVVIDPGHGGEDGGAVSCTGVQESGINLDISMRLNDLLGFLGVPTRMTRTEDVSVHSPEAVSFSEKKVSDLKNRVKVSNQTPNAILVSIHQNMFSESRYRGAQVFYASTPGSKELAERLQQALHKDVDPNNRRMAKQSHTVYLLNKINCPGVLIECGFLSNPEEESKLRDPYYQIRLACSAAVCLQNSIFDQART